MQPQFRVYRDVTLQYYFQFLTSDERMIFESISEGIYDRFGHAVVAERINLNKE